MKIDSIKEFVALRDSLAQEKAQLEQRLNQLNEALAEEPALIGATEHEPRLESENAFRAKRPAGPAKKTNSLSNAGGGPFGRKRRQLSPEARARIAAAQRARWAKSKR